MWVRWAFHKNVEAKNYMGTMAGIHVPAVPQGLGALVAQAVQVLVFQDTVDEGLLGELQMVVDVGPQAGLQIVLQVPVEAERVVRWIWREKLF